MDKEKYDKAYRTILNKLRRETYAEDKNPKYSLDNEHGQKVLDYIKKRLENVNYNPNSGKKEEKMLFRTESLEELNVSEECYEDILTLVEEYINELELTPKEKKLAKAAKKLYDSESRTKEADAIFLQTRGLLGADIRKARSRANARESHLFDVHRTLTDKYWAKTPAEFKEKHPGYKTPEQRIKQGRARRIRKALKQGNQLNLFKKNNGILKEPS